MTVDLSVWQAIGVSVLYAAAILAVGWFTGKFARSLVLRVLRAQKLDEAVSRFLSTMVQYTVLAAAGIAALERVGIESTSLVALLGSAGIAIGLALQGDLSNFASGVMLLIYRPFDLADVISAGGHTGQVSDIGLFACRLSTPDGKVIIIPNSKVLGDSIVNHTLSGHRRGGVAVGVAYGSDVKQVIEILLAAANSVEVALEDPAPAVTFDNLGASSLDFTVYASAKTSDFVPMMGAVRTAVYDALNEAGIDIPFSQIVVHNAAADA